jgi:hypothetical protein
MTRSPDRCGEFGRDNAHHQKDPSATEFMNKPHSYQFVGRIAIRRHESPSELRHYSGAQVDHDPPYERPRRCIMICPSGANALDRRPSRPFRKRFQPQNHLRQKTNFIHIFNSMTPVQIFREK